MEIKHIPDEIINKWVEKKFCFPIEEIAKDLRSIYSFNEMVELEFEFIVNHFSGMNIIIPDLFFDKVSAILAMYKNPYEFSNDVVSFSNVICVCNDLSPFRENVELLEPWQLVRGMDAVDKIFPEDDIDPSKMYLHPNIQNYIFQCYYTEADYILDIPFSSYQKFYYSVFPDEKTRTEIKRIAEEFEQILDEIWFTLKEDQSKETVNKLIELVKDNIQKEYQRLFIMKITTALYTFTYASLLKPEEIETPDFEKYKKALQKRFGINIEEFKDRIKGGKADYNKITEYDLEQIILGIETEQEHTNNPFLALEIALDHLVEIPDYYTRLKKMEEEAKKNV